MTLGTILRSFELGLVSVRQCRVSGEDERWHRKDPCEWSRVYAFGYCARLACERENVTMDPTQISVAIIMAGVAVALVVWLRSNMTATSARRMMAMIKRVGLDPGTLGALQNVAIAKIVRRRCIRCPREALCERWLVGEVEGGNTFCPNAQTFSSLKRT